MKEIGLRQKFGLKLIHEYDSIIDLLGRMERLIKSL